MIIRLASSFLTALLLLGATCAVVFGLPWGLIALHDAYGTGVTIAAFMSFLVTVLTAIIYGAP